jgi:hypothetical protein
LNEDYRDMLHALSDEKVRFILVGAYALAAHGYPRATMDMDIWIMPSPDNAEAVLRALRSFGAPLHNLTKKGEIRVTSSYIMYHQLNLAIAWLALELLFQLVVHS